MGSRNLPVEILNIIFSCLPQNTISQCELVCRSWKTPAQLSLYSNITLTKEQQTWNLINTVKNKQQQSLGILTCTLNYEVDLRMGIEHKVFFDSFIEIFPLLRHFNCSKPSLYYYTSLIQATLLSQWKYIEKISYPTSSCQKDMDLYSTCVLACRNNITQLCIDSEPRESPTYKLMYKLDLFPQLTAIHIKTTGWKFMECTDHINQKCPSLKSVKFELRPTRISTEPSYAPPFSVEPMTNVKYLEVKNMVFNYDHLQHIMEKFPHLNSIIINEYKGYFTKDEEKWTYGEDNRYGAFTKQLAATQKRISAYTVAKFLAFIVDIPYHRVYHLYTTANVADVLMNYWNLCNDHDTPKSLRLRYSRVDSTKYHYGIESTVMILIRSDSELFRKGDKGLVFTYDSVGASLPHLDVIERIGCSINKLAFGGITYYKRRSIIKSKNQNNYNMANGGFLDHILEHCPYLVHLILHDLVLVKHGACCTSPIISHSSITDLSLINVVLCDTVLLDLSIQLPSLKRLTIEDCRFFDNDETMYNALIDMPSNSFETLEICNSFKADNFIIPTKILVKLSTLNFTKYYIYNPTKQISSSTAEVDTNNVWDQQDDALETHKSDYINALEDEECANFHIRCRSITTLKIDLWRLYLSCQVTVEEEEYNPKPLVKPALVQIPLCGYFLDAPHH